MTLKILRPNPSSIGQKIMLKIKKSVLGQVLDHAKNEMPLEACGYLAGEKGTIFAYYAMTNVDASAVEYSLDPLEQFEVIQDIRKRGVELLGVYHSHPTTPARPSVKDILLAYDPNLSYLIISLAGEKETVKSFRIRNKNVEEEKLKIIQ